MRRPPPGLGALLAAAALAPGAFADAGEPAAARAERVLLISIDTLRADHLGSYGGEVATPHLDALAARGVRFADAVAPTPVTAPSHASLLTGLDPPAHGLRDNSGFRLAEGVTTLAQLFAAAGYETGAFVAALPLDSRYGLDRGFQRYDDDLPQRPAGPTGATPAERPAEEVADAALAWLDERAEERWLAWVHFYDPHFPYRPPARFAGDGPAAAYAGEVAYVDEQVGRLLAFLRRREIADSTLVVATADHGEALGDHREQSHGVFAYQATLRVPLLVAPAEPRVVAERVRLVDVAPTLLELVGLEAPAGLDGVSLAGWIAGGDTPEPPATSYFEALMPWLHLGWAPLRGFYDGRHKFIDLPLPELYDLEADPAERRNLCAADGDCSAWARRFRELAGPLAIERPAGAELDPEVRAGLEALGYLTGGRGGEPGDFSAGDDPKRLIGVYNGVNRALEAHVAGDVESALALLEEVIRARPSMPVGYLRAAAIHEEEGRPERAVEVLERAVENGAGDAFVERELGRLLLAGGDPTAAVAHLERARRLDPGSVEILQHLGSAHLAAGRLDAAEEVLARARGLDPSAPGTRSRLGMVLLLSDRAAAAAGELAAAVDLDPEDGQAWAALGFARAGSDDGDGAVEAWRRALELQPRNFDVMINLAFAYLDGDRPDRGLELLRRFVDEAPPGRYARELAMARSVLERATP